MTDELYETEVSEAAKDRIQSDNVCRFVEDEVVGGLEIGDIENPQARIFSTVTMEVEP